MLFTLFAPLCWSVPTDPLPRRPTFFVWVTLHLEGPWPLSTYLLHSCMVWVPCLMHFFYGNIWMLMRSQLAYIIIITMGDRSSDTEPVWLQGSMRWEARSGTTTIDSQGLFSKGPPSLGAMPDATWSLLKLCSACLPADRAAAGDVSAGSGKLQGASGRPTLSGSSKKRTYRQTC
jgi:hypothetical protein